MSKKRHYCKQCGKELTSWEYEEYDGLCERCHRYLEIYDDTEDY